MRWVRVIAVMLGSGLMATGEEPPVPANVAAAVEAYVRAPEGKDKSELDGACALLKNDVKAAAAAVRGLKPLTDGKPGTKHGLKFASGGSEWEYSIHLPDGYDGKRRFPVLVLPDHAAVDAESGIGFWRGKAGAEGLILFRPVIVKLKEDQKVFPNQQFLVVDQGLAAVMRDALTHLRLNYAVDDDRLTMTGLSQSGYYTWYYASSFPDDFAGIVPESSGGPAVRAAIRPLAATFSEKDGALSVSGVDRAEYLASPEDAAAGREFVSGGRRVRAKPDVGLLLEDFKSLGDRCRLAGGAIEVKP